MPDEADLGIKLQSRFVQPIKHKSAEKYGVRVNVLYMVVSGVRGPQTPVHNWRRENSGGSTLSTWNFLQDVKKFVIFIVFKRC